jgi:hypothetical protein
LRIYPYDSRDAEDVTLIAELELANTVDRRRPQLRVVAYRFLGSVTEAEDTSRRHGCGWRGRPTIDNPAVGTDPEHEALLADSVGTALQIVLVTLRPAERIAFVLHDMFALPFDEIATILDRSPQATRQLASRAGRRVQEAAPAPDLIRRHAVVDAYFAAAREGDLDALVAVLDQDVVLRPAAAAAARTSCKAPHRSGAGDGRRAFRAVRSPGAGRRCRRSDRVRRRATVRGARIHRRRRPGGRDRHIQRPRAGRQAQHPGDNRLGGVLEATGSSWSRRYRERRVADPKRPISTRTSGRDGAGQRFQDPIGTRFRGLPGAVP